MPRTPALIALLAVSAATALAIPSRAADPTQMIAGLGLQLQFVARHVPSERRAAEIEHLFEQNFDLPQIAGFVFGGFWRAAAGAQRQELLASFEAYLATTYGERLTEYAERGETPNVAGCRREAEGTIVSSEVALARNPTQGGRGAPLAPVQVDWRLANTGGAYKIVDVIVDGVSLAVTERLELAETVERDGGEPGALVALLHTRTASAAP
jgi:phospholipid transport system substrate-binding protein